MTNVHSVAPSSAASLPSLGQVSCPTAQEPVPVHDPAAMQLEPGMKTLEKVTTK